jgi:hypothetical protein
MSKIKNVNPKKNEVVRIKFRGISEILNELGTTFSEADDRLGLGRNIRAYLQGGDFLVDRNLDESDSEADLGNCLYVKNHFDHDYDFAVHDIAVEKIEIIDDPQIFSSQDHNIMVVRVGDELFINGAPLIGDEIKDEQHHNRYKAKKDHQVYVNKNRKLLEIFENFIADLAVKDSLNSKKGVD